MKVSLNGFPAGLQKVSSYIHLLLYKALIQCFQAVKARKYQFHPHTNGPMYLFQGLIPAYFVYYALAESIPQTCLPNLAEISPNNGSFCDFEPFMLRSTTARKMTNFTIEIVSDPVCPWCYIGKKKLDQAIAIHQSLHLEDTFTIVWMPFYVKPHSPEKGQSLSNIQPSIYANQKAS